MRRLAALATLAAALPALAACGGDEGASGAGVDVVPASASFAAVVDTDLEGEQWQAVDGLVRKFPGGRDGVRGLFALQGDVDLERDVEPALGPELVLVSLRAADPDSFVMLTQPEDPAKLRELAERGDTAAVVRELDDGWWAVAPTEAALDELVRARDAEDPLGESDAWQEATEGLPDEALVTGYASSDLFAESFEESRGPPEARTVLRCVAGGGETAATGFALTAEEDGLRFQASSGKPETLPEPDEGSSELADLLAGDALAFASFRGLGEYLREALRCASEADEEVAKGLAQLELGLGLSLEEDILPLVARETAVAVYGQEGAEPFAALVATQVDDEAQALETVDRIVRRARLLESGLTLQPSTVGGVDARRVLADGEPVFVYGAVDGVLGFASADEALLALTGEQPALADDEAYRAAREAAGAPEGDAGFLYVDVRRIVALLGTTLAPKDAPPDLEANLELLGSLFLWSEVDDDRVTVEGFVRID